MRISYSQFGEDAIVQTLLKQPKGVYVDVGAYHPVLYSNTYGLYRRGWSGVVIDPNGVFRSLYSIFRHRDIFVEAAIGERSESREYYKFDDASYNTFDQVTAEKWQRDRGVRLLETCQISIKSLGEILNSCGIRHIDYMNIDVEGMDAQVLQSHDWTIRPTVISVEDSDFDSDSPRLSEVYALLKQQEYQLIGYAQQTLVFKTERGR